MSFEGIKTARKLTCVASRKEIDALRYSPRGNAGVFNVDIIFYPIDFPSIPQFSGVFYGRKSKRIVFTRACHGPTLVGRPGVRLGRARRVGPAHQFLV